MTFGRYQTIPKGWESTAVRCLQHDEVSHFIVVIFFLFFYSLICIIRNIHAITEKRAII